MNNQKTKQAILVTTQDRADQNQTLERLSLFDEEGNPVSINGGSEEVSFFTLKGEWSPFPEEPYVVNDLVYNITADGDSKISTWWLYEESPTGSDPHEDLEHWQILVSDGNNATSFPIVVNDVPIMPWKPAPAIGENLWNLTPSGAHDYHGGLINDLVGDCNTTDLSPSIIGDGNARILRNRIYLQNLSQGTACYRLSFNIDSFADNGWAMIQVLLAEPGAIVAGHGTKEQILTSVSGEGPFLGRYVFEFKPPPTGDDCTFELLLRHVGNVSSGTTAISDVELVLIPYMVRPMNYVTIAETGEPGLYNYLYDPITDKWSITRTDFSVDGDLTPALNAIKYCTTTKMFNRYPPDPDMLQDTANWFDWCPGQNTESLQEPGYFRSLRTNNNDQIIEVKGSDDNYHMYGNTHDGETVSEYAYFVDIEGNEFVSWDGTEDIMHQCRRLKIMTSGKMTRQSPDNDDFASIDKTMTFFNDGMQRIDRTTTFLMDVDVRTYIEWMSSHINDQPLEGKIGNGMNVLGYVDCYPKLSPPETPTSSTSGSGGSLAAATYAYVVTALTNLGETTPSPIKTQAASGGSSTITIEWDSITDAVGYRIYGRTNSIGGLHLLATVDSLTTDWVDTGENIAFGDTPPIVNTARLLNQGTNIANDNAVHSYANWAAWRDVLTGVVFGNIFDIDTCRQREDVSSTSTMLVGSPGVIKNYNNIHFSDGSEHTIPDGSVYSATHWAFTYMPSDPNHWEKEIASRASDLELLKSIYPTE